MRCSLVQSPNILTLFLSPNLQVPGSHNLQLHTDLWNSTGSYSAAPLGMDRLSSVQNILEQVCGAQSGPAAWPSKGNGGDRGSQPISLTLEFIVSFGLRNTGGRDHRALELEEIFVTLERENARLGEVEGPALGHPGFWCQRC